jgi:hypothetical protein
METNSKIATLIAVLLASEISASASAFSAEIVPPDEINIGSDFEGSLGDKLSDKYQCQGQFKFVHIATPENPKNQALSITLDPKSPIGVGTCESLRGEVAEAPAYRMPLHNELWYSIRFLFPKKMAGKIGAKRFVLAQLKQSDSQCKLSGNLSAFALDDGNPIISARMIEDVAGHVAAIQLDVSSLNVHKIAVGEVMRHSGNFFGVWHSLIIHTNVIPRAEGDRDTAKKGFVEGFLDKQAFSAPPYGLDDKGNADVDDPFGYPPLTGCTYFKFGIYGDPTTDPWNVIVDRFRRGATRADVE